LIDRSGSMYGSTIKLAIEALKLFLYSLPSGSRFNVVSFGSEYSFMFDNSVEYNDSNLDRAVKEIVTFDADMGGTEILSPIKKIFKRLKKSNLSKQLFLLTVGAVNNV
jgi:uncharacterized protein with von Willebrand factor type A (vWA) domain